MKNLSKVLLVLAFSTSAFAGMPSDDNASSGQVVHGDMKPAVVLTKDSLYKMPMKEQKAKVSELTQAQYEALDMDTKAAVDQVIHENPDIKPKFNMKK